ncbi:hypothetical protein BpHYR1_035941 [Brachionus plicatilis]|uniref:Uncharacterized protein n=1 Tax=Brachionus plicatilis TaxID=10195 RepID=A0A3M7QSE1_BRAPC|nr:hypothetical protein BpHYR1_035941 [Brachionus plicatilis]
MPQTIFFFKYSYKYECADLEFIFVRFKPLHLNIYLFFIYNKSSKNFITIRDILYIFNYKNTFKLVGRRPSLAGPNAANLAVRPAAKNLGRDFDRPNQRPTAKCTAKLKTDSHIGGQTRSAAKNFREKKRTIFKYFIQISRL